MDCPNCGAYNASSSYRCRRCNQILPTASAERPDEPVQEERPWDQPDEETSTAWDAPLPGQDVDRDRETSDSPADWYTPEPDPWPPSESWQSEQSSGYGTSGQTIPTGGLEGTAGYGPPPDIPNYLWQSIIVTICCCWPAGIPAIVFASRVNAFKESGNFQQAQETSDKAKMWTIIALALGLFAYVAFFCIALVSEGGVA